jgi:hypothetical protein
MWRGSIKMGSLILSNLRLIKKGMESVTVENIFDEERRKINHSPLQGAHSPAKC